MSTKPKWLIAGGMGMIGRNLVKYLLDNNLASDIRVADKKAPFMAFLSADHKAAIENDLVEVVQADCSDDEHLDKVLEEPRTGGAWDYIVNVAAEMDLNKAEAFHAKQVDIAAKLAAAGARLGVKRFIQISSAAVYAPSSSKAASEASKTDPWTTVAAYNLKAEDAVKATAGLNWVILRPAIVYGPGDVHGLMPRVVVASTYTVIEGGKMELMWEGDLHCNTVHVFDVVRAIYFAARKLEPGTTWNLADGGKTDQGQLVALLGGLFGIKTGFYGTTMSMLARVKMDSAVELANKTHLAPWLALLKAHGIKNTPLSPFLHKQLLYDNALHVDGTAIEAAGFKYAVPALTAEGLRDVVLQHIAQGIFPPVVAGATAAASGTAASGTAAAAAATGGAGTSA